MISVIIPVYNEEIAIKKVLETLPRPCTQGRGKPYAEDLEVIVVDGGSSDKTVEFAKQYSIKLIQCIKNKAVQMNEGAKIAKKDILLFLHADCLLEDGSLKEIVQVLNNGYIGGCLSQKIDSPRLIYPVRNTFYARMYSKISNGVYRFIEKSGNIRAKVFKIFYGDQAIFVRKEIFFKLGGFDDAVMFEDVLFSKKLKKEGRLRVLNNKVFVSPRRWEKNGIMKTTFINWLLTLGFMLGIPLEILKRLYIDVR